MPLDRIRRHARLEHLLRFMHQACGIGDIRVGSQEGLRGNHPATLQPRGEIEILDGAVEHVAYDLVTIFEALHDMSHPVAALAAAHGLLADGGRVLVADERTAERFSVNAGERERLLYGFSVTHCLPVGMVGDGAVGTGTLMRPDTLARYARDAGFTSCDVAPIDNDEFRFYVLTP